MASIGGRMAYESTVQVNGGEGQLEVFHFAKGVDEVTAELIRALGQRASVSRAGSMVLVTIREHGRVIRFLVLRVSSRVETLVFKLDQTASQFESSREPPAEHLVKAVPSYPGSTPEFFVEDTRRGTGLAVATAPVSPHAVHAHFARELPAAGWRPLLPVSPADPETDPPMTIFQRDQDLCSVLVTAADAPGSARITVLHKRQSVK
jgi:hypothetical protein